MGEGVGGGEWGVGCGRENSIALAAASRSDPRLPTPDSRVHPWLQRLSPATPAPRTCAVTASPLTLEAFRDDVPVTSYEDLLPWLDRIRDGESDVLFAGRPVAYRAHRRKHRRHEAHPVLGRGAARFSARAVSVARAGREDVRDHRPRILFDQPRHASAGVDRRHPCRTSRRRLPRRRRRRTPRANDRRAVRCRVDRRCRSMARGDRCAISPRRATSSSSRSGVRPSCSPFSMTSAIRGNSGRGSKS